jgi:hypothetical protein
MTPRPANATARPGDDRTVLSGVAAEILGIGRKLLVELTDAGDIPCTRFTAHSQRRYRVGDLVEYAAKSRTGRAAS